MIRRVELNPEYQYLKEYAEQIQSNFESITHIIQNNRNDVRRDFIEDQAVVVKCFKGMYFTNKLAYSLFRKSKALRSYETSLYLIDNGFLAPDPIASIDCYNGGFLTMSYFISKYYEHTSFNEMLIGSAHKDELLNSFAEFTYNLHRAGIFHKDYSNGNILCNRIDGKLTFCLVDLNRVSFGPVDFERAIGNFSTLTLSNEDLERVIKSYAVLCGESSEHCFDNIMEQKRRRAQFSKVKRNAKAVFFPARLRKETAAA